MAGRGRGLLTPAWMTDKASGGPPALPPSSSLQAPTMRSGAAPPPPPPHVRGGAPPQQQFLVGSMVSSQQQQQQRQQLHQQQQQPVAVSSSSLQMQAPSHTATTTTTAVAVGAGKSMGAPAKGKDDANRRAQARDPKKDNRKEKAKKKLTEEEIKKEAQKKKMKQLMDRKKRGDFACEMRYRNNLPDIPFEPKYLRYPFPDDWLYRYKVSTLERTYKRRVHLDPRLGTDVDVLDLFAMQKNAESVPLSEEDRYLIRKDDNSSTITPSFAAEVEFAALERSAAEKAAANKKSGRPGRAKLAEAAVRGKSWLLKTTYLENDLYKSSDQQKKSENEENLRKRKLESIMKNVISSDGESVQTISAVDRIEKSFSIARDENRQNLTHQSNPDLKPRRILNILPNFALMGNQYHLVHIHDKSLAPEDELEKRDRYPAAALVSEEEAQRRLDHAILTHIPSESDTDNILSYLLPVLVEGSPDSSGEQLSKSKNAASTDDDLDDMFKMDEDKNEKSPPKKKANDDDDDDLFGVEEDDPKPISQSSSSSAVEKPSVQSSSSETKPLGALLPHCDLAKLRFVRDYQFAVTDQPEPLHANRRLMFVWNHQGDKSEDGIIRGDVRYSRVADSVLTLKREKVFLDYNDKMVRRGLWKVDRRDFVELEAGDRAERAESAFGKLAVEKFSTREIRSQDLSSHEVDNLLNFAPNMQTETIPTTSAATTTTTTNADAETTLSQSQD